MKKLINLVVLASLFCFDSSAQQLRMPAPSPPQFVKQDFGLSSIELSYSRPGVKSRQIFGDLIPYGKVWRTGANDATTITFGSGVTIGDKKIPAGKYGLLTIPGQSEWTVIITKQLDVTNSAQYKQDQDMVRVTATANQLPFSLETFSILFNNVTNSSCDLDFVWDKTIVSVPIKTEIDSDIMAQIDNAMNKDNRPYYNAAMYYFENGKDLNKALEWFNKAADQNPKAYFVFYQRARCQEKLGKKQDAITSAQKAAVLAKEAGNADYAAMSEKYAASLK